MLRMLEESTAGRVLLYVLMLPVVMVATPIAFFIQYVLDREFDLGEL
ncbi:MAG: hypothetical protein HPY55_16145 [Firmicutes bacterium]|nr:hypothetical protein [Bacillota bacterium]